MDYYGKNTYLDELNVYEQSKFIISKASYLYFFEGLSQSEIAKKLNISISTVSRLLKQAKEEDIIEIKMSGLHKNCIDLSELIKNKFNLKTVIVAPVNECMSDLEIKKAVALEGARYVQRIISDDDVLGIAWGGTMYQLINFLNPAQKRNSKFVTLHGSIFMSDYDIDVQTLVSRMAGAFSGKKYSMLIHALLSNEKAVNIINNEPYIQNVRNMFDKITVSLSGIGSFKPQLNSPLVTSKYLNNEELSELIKEGVCGDIMLRFFDSSGNECNTSLKNRTLAIDFEKYKTIPNKVVVASGSYKSLTINSAIKGNLVNTLIIDSLLAKSILSD